MHLPAEIFIVEILPRIPLRDAIPMRLVCQEAANSVSARINCILHNSIYVPVYDWTNHKLFVIDAEYTFMKLINATMYNRAAMKDIRRPYRCYAGSLNMNSGIPPQIGYPWWSAHTDYYHNTLPEYMRHSEWSLANQWDDMKSVRNELIEEERHGNKNIGNEYYTQDNDSVRFCRAIDIAVRVARARFAVNGLLIADKLVSARAIVAYCSAHWPLHIVLLWLSYALNSMKLHENIIVLCAEEDRLPTREELDILINHIIMS